MINYILKREGTIQWSEETCTNSEGSARDSELGGGYVGVSSGYKSSKSH